MTYNAANEQQVKNRQRTSKDREEQLQADLAHLLQDPAFRRYLWRVIHEHCQVMQSPFSTNGSAMTLSVGMGDIGRRLWSEVEKVDPLAIPRMMTEYYASQQKVAE